MKSLEQVIFLSIVATAVFVPACHSVSVPEWPYVLEAAEAGTADGGLSGDGAFDEGAPSDGASDDATGDDGQSPSSMVPLACHGALCDTTNYTACNVADSPAERGAARPISVLLLVAGLAFARSRTRRQTEGA